MRSTRCAARRSSHRIRPARRWRSRRLPTRTGWWRSRRWRSSRTENGGRGGWGASMAPVPLARPRATRKRETGCGRAAHTPFGWSRLLEVRAFENDRRLGLVVLRVARDRRAVRLDAVLGGGVARLRADAQQHQRLVAAA